MAENARKWEKTPQCKKKRDCLVQRHQDMYVKKVTIDKQHQE